MPTHVVVAIAEYFHVSADYLLGMTNAPERPMTMTGAEQKLVENFRTLNREQRELIVKTACRSVPNAYPAAEGTDFTKCSVHAGAKPKRMKKNLRTKTEVLFFTDGRGPVWGQAGG